MNHINRRPAKTEYGSYYEKYISLVEGTNIIQSLETSKADFQQFLQTLPADK